MSLLSLINQHIVEFLKELAKAGDILIEEQDFISKLREKMKTSVVHTLVRHYSRSENLNAKLTNSMLIASETIKALQRLGFRTIVIDARLTTSALIGTSQGILKTIFEVGMTWNHILDLPVIPASSIKGAVRGVVERLLYIRCTEDSCQECLEQVNVLFGKGSRESWAGLLLFFDAYPIDVKNEYGRLLEPDIVSPHYMHGTEVRKFERLVEPVPVPHVSIAPGVVFRFIVAAEPSEEVEEALKRLMECFGRDYAGLGPAIASLLLTAFRYGIGARTSRGYGKFEIVKMDVVVDGNKFSTPILFEPSVKRRGRTSRKGGRR